MDRQDILLAVAGHLDDAIKWLKELGDHDADVEALEDVMRGIDSEVVAISDELWQAEQVERQALTREYWQSVL